MGNMNWDLFYKGKPPGSPNFVCDNCDGPAIDYDDGYCLFSIFSRGNTPEIFEKNFSDGYYGVRLANKIKQEVVELIIKKKI